MFENFNHSRFKPKYIEILTKDWIELWKFLALHIPSDGYKQDNLHKF